MQLAADLETGLKHWLDVWGKSRHVSAHRARADQTRIEKYILPAFGRRSVTRLTKEQVEEWVESLREQEIGASTIYAAIMILRQALDLAVDATVLRSNPAKGVRVEGVNVIREPEPEEILDEETLQKVLQAVDPYFRAMILFAARTGARWEEVLGLQEKDLYLREGMATIGRHRIQEQAGQVLESEGEPKETRLVELSPDLVKALEEHLQMTKDWRSKDWDWVFLTKRDHRHPLRPNWNIHVWRPALRGAGLDERAITFQALRHTGAKHMIDQGWDVEKISRALGHATELTTRKTYKRWLRERDETARAAAKGDGNSRA